MASAVGLAHNRLAGVLHAHVGRDGCCCWTLLERGSRENPLNDLAHMAPGLVPAGKDSSRQQQTQQQAAAAAAAAKRNRRRHTTVAKCQQWPGVPRAVLAALGSQVAALQRRTARHPACTQISVRHRSSRFQSATLSAGFSHRHPVPDPQPPCPHQGMMRQTAVAAKPQIRAIITHILKYPRLNTPAGRASSGLHVCVKWTTQ